MVKRSMPLVSVQCKGCGKEYKRETSSLPFWQGHCRACGLKRSKAAFNAGTFGKQSVDSRVREKIWLGERT